MKKSVWVILILVLLYPTVVTADEKQDFEQLLKYAQVVGEGFLCVPEEERLSKIKLIGVWIKNINPRTDDMYIDLFDNGFRFYSRKFRANPDVQSCEQALENWNKIEWPDVNILAGEDEGSASKSNWHFDEVKSKMGDRASVSCVLPSSDTISVGKEDRHGLLVIRCMDNETDVILSWPNYLGRGNDHTVESKVDDKPIVKQKWIESTNGEAVFMPSPIKWLRTLKDARHLIVRLKPYQRGYEELEFDLNGIDDVIGRISEACKWKK